MFRAGRYRVFYTIDEERRAVQIDHVCGSSRLSRPLAAVTFCDRHPVVAIVRRGPVRGPSHLCERCNQRHRWHGYVVPVQVARPERRAVLLIIRRSWVRARPT